jgi:type III restriction enzyme
VETKPLQQTVFEWVGRREFDKTEVPSCILDNLNPSFPVRPYQLTAFRYFVNYWQEPFDGKPRANHQLLFHMATGSGKTMMMAGLILYLYEKGYRNFLFFVNSTNIINKTRDNFLNPKSSKYLFADELKFGNRRVAIREVQNFQSANRDDINIVFTTIQGLHLALNVPAENKLTYDDFENRDIVLLSDEAHHINVDTKKGADVSQEELFETQSWERTVLRLFGANPRNVLLEFTATVDFSDENLAGKYKPKLLFDYPLREFRRDGYSKEVKVLQADLADFDRALHAVLLSQFRRKLFEQHKQHIKPVILFKSKTIKDSQSFLESFKEGIRNLKAAQLERLQSRSADATLRAAFAFFKANNISLSNLVSELREDFSEAKLLSVNSKEESEAKQLAVNSLEDPDNEYRAVFAVDKLNEGWDVLNLFDIVRLYDTRDSKAGKIGKTTMSEAQLIGRGARYCPFRAAPGQPSHARKFDSDLQNELRICEELYYHSAYNPKYIQELNTALQELGIKPKDTQQRTISIKPSFKSTALFKGGHIFLNQQVKYDRSNIDGLDSTLINQRHKVHLRTGFVRSTGAFDTDTRAADREERGAKDIDLQSFGVPVIRKALQQVAFYEFDNLRRYLPKLTSIKEFIESKRYLGKLKLEVTGLPEHLETLTRDDQLDIAAQVLANIAQVISSDKIEYKGTREFVPFMLKDTFTDKTLSFMLDENGDREFGRSMNDAAQTAYHLDLSKRDWYVFNDCFGTSEEKLLVKYIDKRYAELKAKYSDVYLIRNEKHFKLFNFADGRPLEPDFVLYLVGKQKNDTMHYQVFVEPKGTHLLRADEWKEAFLQSIKTEFKVERLFSGKRYTMWGLPFFNSEVRETEFADSFEELLTT